MVGYREAIGVEGEGGDVTGGVVVVVGECLRVCYGTCVWRED